MINQTVARRYAQALFDIAREKGAVDKFAADLAAVTGSLETSPELRRVIYNRLATAAVKQELIKKVYPAGMEPMVANFVSLVLDKAREEHLPAIMAAFNDLVDKENRILRAQVRVAQAISGDQQLQLEKKLSALTGQQILANVQVDPALIGGMSVKIGDVVYDGSIARRLGILKKHLQQGQLGR